MNPHRHFLIDASELALGGIDGLVLAVAERLMEEYGREQVCVVTARVPVARMCRENPELLPPALYTPKDAVPA